MNLTELLIVQHEKSGEQSKNLNIFIASALIHVVENYFLQLSSSFVLTLSCFNSHTSNFYNDIFGKFFEMWNKTPVQIVNMPSNGTIYVPGRRFLNIIFTDSYESFRLIDIISYTAKYDFNEYYYIFLQTRDHLHPYELSRIFEYCWENYIINCNVQVQTAKGEILIYTYFPYTEKNCGKPTTKLINQFIGTKFVNKVLFPKKLLNFYGCKLRAALWDVPPFLYLHKSSNGSYEIQRGFEGRVILELATKLNFSIEVIEPANNVQRGVIRNGNLSGAILMLDKRIVDLSLGCFRLALDRAIVTTATYSFYQSQQIICAPSAAYTFSSLEILLYPFTTSTWLVLFVIWNLSIAMMSAVNKLSRLYPKFFSDYTPTHSKLNILLMAIGMPATKMPLHIFARILCSNWMFFNLIIRTAYQALLFHLIRTQPTKNLPQNFDELVKYNYTVIMNRSTYRAMDSIQFLMELNMQSINDVEEVIAFKYIEKYPRKNLMAAGPLDFLAYYGIEFKKPDVFKLMPQNILSFPITMYLTKHSFLIDQFNDFLMTIRSMGFIEIWFRWELDFNYLKNARKANDAVFGLDELHMAFIMSGVGLMLSTIVFLLELLSKRITWLRRVLNKL